MDEIKINDDTKVITSQMTQRTRRPYSEVEVKAEAEVKIVVRS